MAVISVTDIVCMAKYSGNDAACVFHTAFCEDHLQQNVFRQTLFYGFVIGDNQFLELLCLQYRSLILILFIFQEIVIRC